MGLGDSVEGGGGVVRGRRASRGGNAILLKERGSPRPQGEPGGGECESVERGRECEAQGRAGVGLIHVLDYNSSS